MKEVENAAKKGFKGFEGTPDEKVQTLIGIYTNLDTIEEKLEFITEVDAFYKTFDGLKEPYSKEENGVVNAIKADFIKNYITGGKLDTQKVVFQTVGKLISANAEEKAEEAVAYSGQYNDEKRNAKGEWLSGSSAAGIKINSVAGFLAWDLLEAYRNDKETINKIWEEAHITEETTIEEFARACGMTTKEDIDTYVAPLKVDRNGKITFDKNSKIVEVYRDMYPDRSEAEIKEKLLEELMDRKTSVLEAEGHRRNIGSKVRTDEEITRINHMFKKSTGESGTKEIDDWIEAEGELMSDGISKNSYKLIRTDFVTKYILPYRKLERETQDAAVRRKAATAKAYSWLFNKTEAGGDIIPTEEEKAAFVADTNIHIADKYNKTHMQHGSIMADPRYVERFTRSMRGNRSTTHESIFMLWALGTHDDVTFDDLERLAEDPRLVEEFAKFCDDNPTRGAVDEKTFSTSVKKWNDMILKATDKIKKYTLPAIDHNDPELLKKHINKYFILNALCVDFLQEKDWIFENNRFTGYGREYAADKMGQKKWNDTIGFWTEMQDALGCFSEGYSKNLDMEMQNAQIIKRLYGIAANREAANIILNQMAGKKLAEGVKIAGLYKRIGARLSNELDELGSEEGKVSDTYKGLTSIDVKTVVKYLNGKDTETFRQKLNPVFKKAKEVAVKSANDSCISHFSGAQNAIRFGGFREKLLSIPDTKEGMLNFVTSKEGIEFPSKGKFTKPLAWIEKTVGTHFLDDEYRILLDRAGLSFDEAVLINGKTPKALWGEKYADVKEPLKNRCYQAELLKKIAEAKSDIKFKVVSVGPKGRVKVEGAVSVFKSLSDMQDLKYNLAVYKSGVKEITDKLKQMRTKLLNTHNTESWDEAFNEIGTIGSKYFKKMETTLNESIKALEDKEMEPDKIREKLVAFKAAADKYHKERYSSIRTKKGKGKVRLDTATDARNLVPDFLMTFDNLRKGIGGDLVADQNHTFENAPISKIENKLNETFGSKHMNDIYHLDKAVLSEEELKDLTEGVKELSHEQVIFTNKIIKGIESIGKDSVKAISSAPKTTSPTEAALAYHINCYLVDMRAENMNVNRVKSLEKDFEKRIEDGSFKRDVEKLARNQQFKEMLRNSGGLKFNEWRNAERQAAEVHKAGLQNKARNSSIGKK